MPQNPSDNTTIGKKSVVYSKGRQHVTKYNITKVNWTPSKKTIQQTDIQMSNLITMPFPKSDYVLENTMKDPNMHGKQLRSKR